MSDVAMYPVTGCSRCGENHDPLEFRKFAWDCIAERWATCPNTGDPILMFQVEAPAGTEYAADEPTAADQICNRVRQRLEGFYGNVL